MAERAGVVSGGACLGGAAALADPFLDLGAQPLANAFVRPEDAARLLLPWNLVDEIVAQQGEYLRKGGAFIVGIPTPRVIGAAP